VLKSHDLLGFVDDSEPCPAKFLPSTDGKESTDLNPEYLLWVKKDQFVLSWLNASLIEKVLSTTYGIDTSRRQLWMALSSRYASQSHSRVQQLQRQLQNLHQGSKTCTEYLREAKLLTDQLAAIGQPIDKDNLISYLLGGLNASYTTFITTYSFALCNSTMSFNDFQIELLSHETLLDQQHQAIPFAHQSIAMVATKSSHYGPRKSKPQYRLAHQPNNLSTSQQRFSTPQHRSSMPQ
jgi:hypothetical protein